MHARTQGVELEKQLLACLKELSRVFNISAVLDQYQAETFRILAAAAAAADGGGEEGGWVSGRAVRCGRVYI